MNKTAIDRAALAVVVLVIWEAVGRVAGTYWISTPWLVLSRMWALALNGDLWFHGRFTLGEALGGFCLGAVPGCLAAMLLRRHPFLRSTVMSVAAIGYAVPKTALVPLFILWLGVGPGAKVALVASAVFFIVFYSTLNGVDAVDDKLLQSAKVMGASERQILWHVVGPSVVPFVFGGLRVAIPYAIGGAIVCEIISSNRGIGFLTQFGATDFDTTLVVVSLVVVMIIVLSLSAVLAGVQRRLLRWQSTSQAPAPVTGA